MAAAVLIVGLAFVFSLDGQFTWCYDIDTSPGLGRRFDGIGGLSGGGATSKLLVSYDKNYRDQILDYLFKPNFGASLHILKVEIGGDSQSTDGTESSHMHESWDENYNRGYEWWLMTEAKKRNPDIKLYGLPWAFPGWLGKKDPYGDPQRTSDYIIRWINGAKNHYNLTIDYIGIWNERQYNITYIKTLHKALANNGLSHIKLVASDGSWGIADDILKDSQLAAAVDIIGTHYSGTKSSTSAQETNKTLWSSEDYSTFNDNVGGGCWARIVNQNYAVGYMTSTISWNLIAAYYFNLPFGRDGLMTAMEPWSGHYVVESPIWITAHTTQFSQPGWIYLMHGSGVGKLNKGGSFVSMVDPEKKDLTVVIETMSHDHSKCIRPPLPKYSVEPQLASFELGTELSHITSLHIWYSKLGFENDKSSTTLFKYLGTKEVAEGKFSVLLGVDEVITLTTLPVGQKGSFSDPPPSKPFPLPYSDDFEEYDIFSEASNFVPQVGVWEVRQSNNPAHGQVNRQVVLQQPVDWCANSVPINIGGNYNWTDAIVEVDVMVPAINGTSGVMLAGRVSGGGCHSDASAGIYLFFYMDGTFTLKIMKKESAIHNGTLPVKLTKGTWYHIGLKIETSDIKNKEATVSGIINGVSLGSFQVSGQANGFVGYGTVDFGLADFDNFGIFSTGGNEYQFRAE